MKKPIFTYTVYDTEKNETVITDGKPSEIEAKTGINKSHISRYANGGYLYKGRYKITSAEIKPVQKMEKYYTAADRRTIAKFNAAMEYLSQHYRPEFLRSIVITSEEERQAV